MKTTIRLNDKLYKQTMNKQHSNQQSKKTENYIEFRTYEKSAKLSRREKHLKFITTFMKLNAVLFKKFKNNEKNINDKKKNSVLRV